MSEARAHAGLVDERFGGIINRTPFTTLWRVHVHRQPVNLFPRCGRQGDFIGDGLLINWLQVLDTAERTQIYQRVRHQFHAVVSLLEAFKAEQQPLELVLPGKGPLNPQA